jgi:hypothetical protein
MMAIGVYYDHDTARDHSIQDEKRGWFMSKDQNSFAKRQREMAKKRKAEEKRERRRKKKEQARASAGPSLVDQPTTDV